MNNRAVFVIHLLANPKTKNGIRSNQREIYPINNYLHITGSSHLVSAVIFNNDMAHTTHLPDPWTENIKSINGLSVIATIPQAFEIRL